MNNCTSTILYYIHHHGSGHLQRAKSLLAALPDHYQVVLLVASESMQDKVQGTFPTLYCECLPSKWPADAVPTARTFNRAFEGVAYTPEAGNRAQVFCTLLLAHKVDVFISDVSAELTILARAAGVPCIMQRHSGNTAIDPTQNYAYECAEALFAPYPQVVENEDFAYQFKTHYLGFFSPQFQAHEPASRRGLTLISTDPAWVASVLAGLSQINLPIWVVGCDGPSTSHIHYAGFCQNITQHVPTDIVVCSGGNNLLSELIIMGKKLIITPEPRPYDEQVVKANRLAQGGYAVMMESQDMLHPSLWQQAIQHAAKIDISRTSALVNPHAAAQFAALIKDVLCLHSQ